VLLIRLKDTESADQVDVDDDLLQIDEREIDDA
jgi:hypothetical protein